MYRSHYYAIYVSLLSTLVYVQRSSRLKVLETMVNLDRFNHFLLIYRFSAALYHIALTKDLKSNSCASLPTSGKSFTQRTATHYVMTCDMILYHL